MKAYLLGALLGFLVALLGIGAGFLLALVYMGK